MTDQHQAEILRLLPAAEKSAARYAKRFQDDEYVSVARLALCEAVVKYDASRGMTLDAYVSLCVRNALNNEYRKQTREQSLGLRGGAPTVAEIEASSSNGRRVRKTNVEADGTVVCDNQRDMNVIAAPSSGDPYARIIDLIEMLPARLQQIAYARWVDGDELGQIATDEEMSYDQVRYALREATQFAKFYLTGE